MDNAPDPNGTSFDPSAATNKVNCTSEPAPVVSGHTSTYPVGGQGVAATSGCAGPDDSFANELSSIPSADYANAIFYYSVGKFNIQWEGIKTKIQAGVDKSVNTTLGEVNQKFGSEAGGSTAIVLPARSPSASSAASPPARPTCSAGSSPSRASCTTSTPTGSTRTSRRPRR